MPSHFRSVSIRLDGHGICHSTQFDHNGIQFVIPQQQIDTCQELVGKIATRAAILQLDDSIHGARNQFGIDIDRSHVIDNDSNFDAIGIFQQVLQSAGFAGSQKAACRSHVGRLAPTNFQSTSDVH
jgi:hypothetical protein